MKTPIVVILGNSGAGKDTLAGIIKDVLRMKVGKPSEIVKFVKPFKKALSIYLGVPVEQLEDRIYRVTPIPELGCTPLDLMIRGYEVMPLLHPRLGLYSTGQEVSKLMDYGRIPIFTDCRNSSEVDYLQILATPGHPLFVFTIERMGEKHLKSDEHLGENINRLASIAAHWGHFDNNGTLSDLANQVLLHVGSFRNATGWNDEPAI